MAGALVPVFVWPLRPLARSLAVLNWPIYLGLHPPSLSNAEDHILLETLSSLWSQIVSVEEDVGEVVSELLVMSLCPCCCCFNL